MPRDLALAVEQGQMTEWTLCSHELEEWILSQVSGSGRKEKELRMYLLSRRILVYLGLVVALAGLTMACSSTAPASSGGTGAQAPAASNYPTKPVEIMVTGAAGGGFDQRARGVEQALTKEMLFSGTLTVNYYDGGAGVVGMSKLAEQKGSGYALAINSNRVYLQKLLGRTELGVADCTPIARLASDFEVIAVKKDSPYKTVKDVFDALKKDPKSVSIANGLAPNDDQMMVLRSAKLLGIDITKLNMVSFSAGGAVMTNLLGGHVDAAATGMSEALPQAKSGDVRILGISAPQRLTGDLKDVPTLKEQGIDVVLYHWRGIYGAPGMAADAKSYWLDTFKKMNSTATWKSVLDQYGWSDSLLLGDDFTKDLTEEEKITKDLLGPLGILPTATTK